MKEHYRALLVENHDTAKVCSWKSEEVADRNFAAVAQIFAHETEPFTVYDVGCGVAAMADFLRAHVPLARYSGCDILAEMIGRAKERDASLDVEQRDILIAPPARQFDYVVISGLFNLRMNNDPRAWQTFVDRMIQSAFAIAGKGLASNFLTGHVEWTREQGYYQDPSRMLDYAIRNVSRFCELRHAYYPWEFTLCVYRQPIPLAFGPPPAPWPPPNRRQP